MTCQLPMTLELTRKNGADPERFLLRFAGKEDIAGIQKLQDAVYDALPDKSIFMKDTEEEISTSIDLDWCLVTEAADGRLAAYTVVVANRISPQNLGHYLDYSEEEMRECVTYDTTYVHPDFRGYGLQRLFIPMKDEAGRSMGARWALCTVAPDNTHSLSNVNALGFEVIGRKEMYGGKDRFVLRKEL